MRLRFGWVPLATLMVTPAAQAQPVGYEEALRAAQVDQPVVQAREAEVRARRAIVGAAAELPDPKVKAGITNFPVTGPNAFGPTGTMMTMLQVGVEQDLPNLAKRHARTGAARSEIVFAQARLEHAEHVVRIATGAAWIALAYAQRRLAIADAAQRDLRTFVPVAVSAVAAGSARPAESLGIRRALIDLDDAVTRMAADRDAAAARLARYVPAEDPVATGETPSPEVDVERLRATLERNPEVVLADAGIERASAAVDIAEAERRPDFGVSASYGLRDGRYGDLFSVMGSVTLPIFAGRRQEPRIRAAESEEVGAIAVREDQLREIRAQFEEDLAAWRSAMQQWQRARDELLPLARDRAGLETASFAARRAELVDVIEAKTAVALLELEILEREEAAVEAAAKLQLTYREHMQ